MQDSSATLQSLRQLLWRHLGIVRTEAGLLSGLDQVRVMWAAEDVDALCAGRLLLARNMFEAALARLNDTRQKKGRLLESA